METSKKIQHKEVILLLVGQCATTPSLAAALMAVGDIMVSDHHGNKSDMTLWFKAVYCKMAVTRAGAAGVLLNEIPMLSSLEGRQRIHWGADMTTSNRPPSRHDLAVSTRPPQHVVLEGPGGLVDTQNFTRLAMDDVLPMASTNVSFEFVDDLAAVADTGGQGIHKLVAGTSLEETLPWDQFWQFVDNIWFPEDWPPLQASPFIMMLGRHLFQQGIAVYHNVLANWLSSCSLPLHGITLYKAKCNFFTDQFHAPADNSFSIDIFASFSAGEVCIANETPLPSRVEWEGFQMDGQPDPIENDQFHVVNGLSWPAHLVNIGQFFNVNEGEIMMKPKSYGIIFQHKLVKMTAEESHQWFVRYFNRLAHINGTQAALTNGRMAAQSAIMQQQLACAQAKAQAPLHVPRPAMPPITMCSVPAVPAPVPAVPAPVPPVIDFAVPAMPAMAPPVPAVPSVAPPVPAVPAPMHSPIAPAPQLPNCQL